MGILYGEDLDRIQLGWFNESAKLRGIEVKFYETLEESQDIYTDVSITSSQSPVIVNALLLEFPATRETLNMYGWYSENPQFLPILMMVPVDLEFLSRWTRVELPARIAMEYLKFTSQASLSDEAPNFTDRDRIFEVSNVSSRLVYPNFYTISVVPVFTDTSPEIDSAKNSTFIDIQTPEVIVG